jgi:Protein of unknown function (DUF1416)
VRRAALVTLVLVLLASSLASIPGALGASPNYALTGYVYNSQGGPVNGGVQVDLVSRATGAIYTTTVSAGGGFTFTSTSTSGALVPGYWGLWVPPQANASFVGCKPCAAIPENQSPTFGFLSSSDLTPGSSYAALITGVNITKPYTATLSGTVTDSGIGVPDADVQLLDPAVEGFVLANNTTVSSGAYNFKAPPGTWVIKATEPGGAPNYSNLSAVTVVNPTVTKNLVINHYLAWGSMRISGGGFVPSSGNATLYDGYNHYIYSSPTEPGGYYALGTYPGNFTSGSQSFEVILAAVGYSTSAYSLVVPPTPVRHDVVLPTVLPSQLGVYSTTLNFSGFNVLTGSGNLSVNTVANLGNDTVFSNLPNATVGQLWAQLGLDFGHSLYFSSALLSTVYAWANSTGPFFPAAQAGTTVNATPFVGPTSPETLSSESSTCSGSCGLSSPATLSLAWSEKYALNSTVYKNSSRYALSFNFRHPTSAEVYNYTVVLPTGYVLQSGTSAPSNTRLVAAGTGGTWTKFTLVSLPSPTAGGTFSFTIVRYSSLTAIVNASVTNFAFSTHNVLNSTNGNYTVEVGVGQNVTWSALNSIYPAGSNGTKFAWVFGDGGSATTAQPTTYHTYTTASGATADTGTLTVTSSGGLTDSTTFHVWVAAGPVTAGIASNATAYQTRSAGGTTYLWVNWSTTLKFNATLSTAEVSPSATVAGVLSVASFSLVAKGFQQKANYSVGQGAYFGSNYTVQFLGAGSYLTSGTVNAARVAFKGWQYNLTLTVWSGTGQSASTTLVVLVNDTEKPVPAFRVLNSAGAAVSGAGIIAGSNASALVQLDGTNATDPHNGSISRYYWHLTNAGNSSAHNATNVTAVKPYPRFWLPAQTGAYSVNLTVWDLNGNMAWTKQSLTVSINTTTSPVMSATNLTGPSKLTAGTSYTFSVNVTDGIGTKSVANNVQVNWYYTSPGGTGRTYIAGTPGSVKFYNYTSPGVPNSSPFAVGSIASLAYNKTVLAVISWTPVHTGNYQLYANVTAMNEFAGDYSSNTNVATMPITVSPNPTTQLLEYVAIGAAVVVVLLLIIFYYRRRSGRGRLPKTSGRSGLERGAKRTDEDEEDEDESS